MRDGIAGPDFLAHRLVMCDGGRAWPDVRRVTGIH
jgi:hypothetical protein